MIETVETDAGKARITWHEAESARLVLAVSHGAGGGVEARDLQALARVLPGHGVSVALVEQPWRPRGPPRPPRWSAGPVPAPVHGRRRG
ncbi:hypothetical protein ACWEN3_41175, partial [Streptomyces sp. NPDC004561]